MCFNIYDVLLGIKYIFFENFGYNWVLGWCILVKDKIENLFEVVRLCKESIRER